MATPYPPDGCFAPRGRVHPGPVSSGSAEFRAITATTKRSVAALRDAGVEFAVAGSLAVWARGGPETIHDLDLVVRREDADRALKALAEAGMRAERPPEGWLVKAWDGDVCVDLIWRLAGIDEVGDLLARAEPMRVMAVDLHVIALEDVLVSKLLAFDEHNLDFGPLLRIARAVREQVAWERLRPRVAHSAYALGFLALLEHLRVIPRG